MQNSAIFGAILISALLRFLPHPPNMAPIAGLALLSGAYLSKRKAVAVCLSAMFFSDIFLGFHSIVPFVYGSFILTVLIGSMLKNHQKGRYFLGASLVSSVLFFIITNFGVWLMSGMYPQNFSGLINAYLLALPFFRNTIVGDLIYTTAFFYGFNFIKTINWSTRLSILRARRK